MTRTTDSDIPFSHGWEGGAMELATQIAYRPRFASRVTKVVCLKSLSEEFRVRVLSVLTTVSCDVGPPLT